MDGLDGMDLRVGGGIEHLTVLIIICVCRTFKEFKHCPKNQIIFHGQEVLSVQIIFHGQEVLSV